MSSNPTGGPKKKLETRIAPKQNAFFQIKAVLWNGMEVMIKLKIRIYQAVILHILLNGCMDKSLGAGSI